MKKLLISLICFVLIFLASIKSDVFHKDNCYYVGRIKAQNLISFKTSKEAIKKGYRPCKVCRPAQ